MKLVSISHNRGQMAIEYLLIASVIAIIALTAFNGGLLANIYHSQSPEASPNGYFTSVTRAIQGEKPQKIDGGTCPGTGTCECPAPAFGGSDC